MRLRVSIIGALTSIALLLSFAPAYAADCSNLPGTREATAADDVVKNGQIAAGTCYNPNDAHIGQNAESAKAYLKTLPRTGSAADDNNINKLNDAFAKCAKRFLEDFIKKNGPVTISSAYRSPAYDAAMCRNNPACGALMNNPNPNGNHQRGLAMDVWQGGQGSSDNAKIRDYALQNPQYGVCFPFAFPGQGFYDRPHMILAGGPGSEGNGPGCRGVTKPCDGSNFNPKDLPSGPSGPMAGNPGGSPTGVSAPTGGTNNPFASSFNPTQQGIPASFSPSGQSSAPIPGSSGYPNAGTNYPSIDTTGPNTVSYTGSYTAAYPTTTAAGPNPVDVLEAMGGTASGGRTSTTTTTGTSVKTSSSTRLNDDLQDVDDITATADPKNSNISDIAYSQTISSTSVNVPRAEVQNTFANAPQDFPQQNAAQAPNQPTLMLALLSAMRSLLQSFVLMLGNGSAYGFKGAWQAPAAAPTFEY